MTVGAAIQNGPKRSASTERERIQLPNLECGRWPKVVFLSLSGGGVLNAEGRLVGIPCGRKDGDFRFSFIVPLAMRCSTR